jgi:hypothetical protein
MFTSEQYRAKAAEYAELMKTASSADEVGEFHKLEQSFTELADNEQWVTDHHDQTLHAAEDGAGGVTLAAVEKLCLAMTGSGGYQPSGEDSSASGVDPL